MSKVPHIISALLDEDFEAKVADFAACRKPDRWKYRIVNTCGQIHVIRREGHRFVQKCLGVTAEMVPLSVATRMQQRGEFGRIIGPRDMGEADNNEEAFFRRLDQNLTGNHRSKLHKVAVPTQPGQPVRG